MKIKTAIKDWLVECEIRKYTPKTLRGYGINLNVFLRFCEEEAEITDMDDINMAVIKKFTQTMIKKGHKGTYVNGLLKSAKSFIQYIYDEYEEGFNTRNKRFTWVKEERPIIKPFKPKDVRYILNNCKGVDYLSQRDTAIITLLIETGVRCWELCCIQPKDVHEDFIIIQGKNHKQRAIPITPVLKKALMRYERTKESYFSFKNMEPYYFLSNTGRQLTNSGMEHMIRRRSKGIDSDVRCSPHTFRHTFAQMQLKMGTDLYTLSRLLGHESVSITQIYLRSLEDAEIVKMSKQNSVLLNM